MNQKHKAPKPQSAGSGELAAALLALTRLDAQVVERCPSRSCPVCASAVTIAA